MGDRIRLDHTNDKWTDLKPGATGTVREFWSDDLLNDDGSKVWRIKVEWDDGGIWSLLVGVDRFSKVPA